MQEHDIQPMSQFLATENSTLLGARNGILSESNSRMVSFLILVAGGIIALAFVAQVSELGPLFIAFSIVIFLILFFVGITTFIRLAELSVSEARLIQAINRIRHFYLEVTPEAESYVSFPAYDDPDAIDVFMLPFTTRFHPLATMVGQMAMINSFLAGAFASTLAAGLLSLSLLPVILIGLIVWVLVLGLLSRFGAGLGPMAQQSMQIRFPTPNN
jgi:hypothetical protein